MDVYKETSASSDLKHGAILVGLAPVPLSLVALGVVLNRIKASRGIMIRNMSLSVVYVGAENVTTENGFPISPSNVIVIPVDDPEFVFLIAGDADCDCRWILV